MVTQTVAFDVDEAVTERDNGYAIEHHRKPPSLALEVASPMTGRNDYTTKREGYARFGISEYWRTDPSGGVWHDTELAGDRLQDGEYVSIPIERVGRERVARIQRRSTTVRVLGGRWPALLRS